MPTSIDETELARLEQLKEDSDNNRKIYGGDTIATVWYQNEAANAVPALVAEVRRLREHERNNSKTVWRTKGTFLEREVVALREKVEAWEWWEEVRTYDTDAFHPYREHKYANPYEDKKAKAYGTAYLEWAEMWHAAREAVHIDE